MATTNPKCSHCGYELDDEETWHGTFSVGKVFAGDEDYSALTCPNRDCGETFYVRCVHDIRFVPVNVDGDDL